MRDFTSWYKQNQKNFYALAQDLTNAITSNAQDIPIHSVRSRVKTLEDAKHKIRRKNYDDPILQLQDIVGLRIVTLFVSDAKKIEQLIKKVAHIVSDHKQQQTIDQFRYSCQHYIVKIKQKSSSSYQEQKNLLAEIQVRTLLQEAWSEMEHYVNYKKVGVDNSYQRKIHQLAALLELSDQQFDLIAKEYQNVQSKNIIQKKEINTTLLYHYMIKEYGSDFSKDLSITPLQFAPCLKLTKKLGITDMKRFQDVVENNKETVLNEEKLHMQTIQNNPSQWPQIAQRIKKYNHFFLPQAFLELALQKEYEKRLH